MEAVEAEMHRLKFASVLAKHPTRGRSFLEACDPGIIDLVDDFAPSGEGVSRLLADAASKRQRKVVHAMLTARANLNYHTTDGETALTATAAKGYSEIARELLAAGADASIRPSWVRAVLLALLHWIAWP